MMETAETAEASLPPRAAPRPTSIVTRMRFPADVQQVWDQLMFYEQIRERPPLHLRLLLPEPIRTEGRVSQVGDDARCLYARGHLLKRATRIDPGSRYDFEVIEQNLTVGGGVRLFGGAYALTPAEGGGTEVALETRYVSLRRPRWFWKVIEAAVCHMFHRHILRAMRRDAERHAAMTPRTESQ